jgi:hypothetical protein
VEANKMKSAFLDKLHELCQSYARTHLNLRDERNAKPQKLTDSKSEDKTPRKINPKLKRK